ncbi:MAG: putative porin [Bacteroidota bacterium]
MNAQFPGDRSQGGFNTQNAPIGGTQQSQADRDTRDTFGVYYFYADQPNLIEKLDDTTLFQFDIYNPVYQKEVQYAHLGNFGSAHQPILYETPFRQGFDVGYHQFDAYYIQPEEVQFKVLEKPFSRVFYSRGATQADGYFKGQFNRNFADGLSITIEGKTIRQLGDDRQYPNQRVEDEAVGFGMWWNAPSENYDGFLYFTSNTTSQEENGGLINVPISGDSIVLGGSASNTADVFLPSGTRTRHAHKTVGYRQYLKLIKTKKQAPVPSARAPNFSKGNLLLDSTRVDTIPIDIRQKDSIEIANPESKTTKLDSIPTKSNRRAFIAVHKIQFASNNYKFFDTQADEEGRAAYYGPLFTDSRGLRNFISWQELENSFQLSTFRSSKNQSNQQGIDESDRLEIGLTHKLHLLEQDQRDSILNNLFITGKLNFNIKNRFKLSTYAHLGLLANAGDFRLSGNLFFDVGKVGNLSIDFVNQAYEPFLIQQEFYVSQRPVWQQDLRKTISTSLTGVYELPSFNLRLSGGYHLINNFIYYDVTAAPIQAEEALNILQLNASHKFRFWKFIFQNQIAFQVTTQDFFRTPNWISYHRLYLDAKIFKGALDFQLGAELRMNDAYFANTYQPLLGQFHLQDRQEINFYPALDAFLNVKIKTVRAFLRTENLTNFLTENTFYYQVAAYAQPLFYLRFGFDWRFVN